MAAKSGVKCRWSLWEYIGSNYNMRRELTLVSSPLLKLIQKTDSLIVVMNFESLFDDDLIFHSHLTIKKLAESLWTLIKDKAHARTFLFRLSCG